MRLLTARCFKISSTLEAHAEKSPFLSSLGILGRSRLMVSGKFCACVVAEGGGMIQVCRDKMKSRDKVMRKLAKKEMLRRREDEKRKERESREEEEEEGEGGGS